jgi:hypothetical protein
MFGLLRRTPKRTTKQPPLGGPEIGASRFVLNRMAKPEEPVTLVAPVPGSHSSLDRHDFSTRSVSKPAPRTV